MASLSDRNAYIELNRYTLRAARTAGSAIEFFRECPLDQKAVVEEVLASLGGGGRVRAVVTVAPQPIHWHRSTAEEAARHRSEDDLRACAAALPQGAAQPFELITCQAHDGAPVQPDGKAPWLLGIAPASALAHEIAAAKQRGFDLLRVESVTTGHLGAAVAAARAAGAGPVLLWNLGLERSQLFLASAQGIEAVAPCGAGLDAVFGAVQSALGLKFRGAASRLFFNEEYDFTQAAPKISAVVEESLREAAAALPLGEMEPALACIGLTDRQDWFLQEISRALGWSVWKPDAAALAGQWSLEFASDVTLTRSALGLLHVISSHLRADRAWHPAWIQPEVVRIAAHAVALPTAGALTATPVPAMAEVGVRSSEAVVESGSVVVAAAAPAATAKEKPAITSKATPAISYRAEREDRAAAATDAPSATSRRRGYGSYVSIAAGIVFAAVAAKFYFDAQAAKSLAETQKQEAARVAETAEARARELEERAKAEAARIRQEAEAARESAVALARRQAEEQTRHQISAELEAERIAKSPGILIVTTSPSGADVSIDGVPRGKSPLALNDIMPGSRQVVIALAGHEPVERSVSIRGSQTADLGLVELQRVTGTLMVSSTPENVDFVVQRVDATAPIPRTGRTPAQFDDMEPGEYVLTFSRAEWPELKQSVSVAKQGIARADVKFVAGSLILTSTPAGATVKQGGRVIGTTPLELPGLPPRTVSFELHLAGHEPATVTGEVKPGERLRLDAVLLSFDRIALQSEVKTPPQPYETPAPRISSVGGNGPQQVNVSFTVWRDGSLRDVSASGTADKDLAKRCVEAVSKWKFRPGLGHDDRPLNVRVTLPIMIAQES
jgi:hypothetical protein